MRHWLNLADKQLGETIRVPCVSDQVILLESMFYSVVDDDEDEEKIILSSPLSL